MRPREQCGREHLSCSSTDHNYQKATKRYRQTRKKNLEMYKKLITPPYKAESHNTTKHQIGNPRSATPPCMLTRTKLRLSNSMLQMKAERNSFVKPEDAPSRFWYVHTLMCAPGLYFQQCCCFSHTHTHTRAPGLPLAYEVGVFGSPERTAIVGPALLVAPPPLPVRERVVRQVGKRERKIGNPPSEDPRPRGDPIRTNSQTESGITQTPKTPANSPSGSASFPKTCGTVHTASATPRRTDNARAGSPTHSTAPSTSSA